MLVGQPKAYLYFDVAFVVVIISLLLQGWTLGAAARRLHVALPRSDRGPRRIELDLPGQLEQQLVGYAGRPKSLFFRRGLVPSWSKPTLVIRDEHILSPNEADPIAPGDYIYLLAPPERAEALDRFFVDMQPSSAPDPHLLGDFMVSGEHTLSELAEIYGVKFTGEQFEIHIQDDGSVGWTHHGGGHSGTSTLNAVAASEMTAAIRTLLDREQWLINRLVEREREIADLKRQSS